MNAAAGVAGAKRVVMVADNAKRLALLEEHRQAALVSEDLPLRANLSVMENIATVLQFRTNSYIGEANDVAWELLVQVGHAGSAQKRDPELTTEERFVAKLLRATVLRPPLILIDRPAQLLPDTNYPFFLNRILLALQGRFEQCLIVDYAWNAPLYNRT
jgi:ABC-type lipoprotein export system ATPase subunit